MTCHLEGRRECRHIPRLDFGPDGAGAVSLVQGQPAIDLGGGKGHVVGGEGLFDPGETMGLPPAAGAQAVPERNADRLGDVGPHPRRQVIPDARHDREPRRADLVDSGADTGRLRSDDAADLGVGLLVVPRIGYAATVRNDVPGIPQEPKACPRPFQSTRSASAVIPKMLTSASRHLTGGP